MIGEQFSRTESEQSPQIYFLNTVYGNHCIERRLELLISPISPDLTLLHFFHWDWMLQNCTLMLQSLLERIIVR